jgi:murein DD-endopeptidase MepM/ murein hydrolase activator NlpD
MLEAFPVARSGRPTFSDQFGKHEGTDIFAPRGTAVLACSSGVVREGTDPKGGLVATLTEPDGTRYYYAHLEAFTGSSPRNVRPNEAIGTVGTSGNAAGGRPHLHFEIHPKGGAPVNPFPELLELQLPVAYAPLPKPPSSSSSSSAPSMAGGLLLLLLLAMFGGRKW